MDDDELFVQPTDPGQIYDGLNIVTGAAAEEQLKESKDDDITQKVRPVESRSGKAVTTSLVLPFQQRIVADVLSEDGLLILARGMGMLKITVNLIHSLDVLGCEVEKTDTGQVKNSLVLVLGATDDDNSKIREGLRDLATLDGLNVIKSEFDEDVGPSTKRRGMTVFDDKAKISNRKLAYAKGGVYSLSNVIAVADMLNGTIDRKMVTGIVVLNAHRVREDSGVSFALNLFRDANKDGFIKAISDQPERFSTGFSALTKQLKWLRVSRLWLWPRFHVKVRQVLDSNRDVVEIAVWPSESMMAIAKNLRAIMETSLSQLRQLSIVKQNVENANDNWTLDNAILKNFIATVRSSLRSVWHQMKSKNIQLIYDIGELLQLLERSTTSSAIPFLVDIICLMRVGRIGMMKGMTSWIEHPAADELIKIADERVTKEEIEEPPKWDQLGQILEEIAVAQQYRLATEGSTTGPILILCNTFPDELRKAIANMKKIEGGVFSAQSYLKSRRQKFRQWKKSLVSVQSLFHSGASMMKVKSIANVPKIVPIAQVVEQRPHKLRRVRGGGTVTVGSRTPASPGAGGDDEDDDNDIVVGDVIDLDDGEPEEEDDFAEVSAIDQGDEHMLSVDMSDVVIVHQYDASEDEALLEELSPSYVIFYEPDIAFIRRVEEYRYNHQVKVYFMYYKDSVEEQRYLASVRREKDCFTSLIHEKAKMPIIIDDADTFSETPAILRAVSSRIAGGQIQIESEHPRIIVDSREIKSSLPFQIYKHKCEVVPGVLIVGDYVLTPDICVERKSISDLVGSLNSGRLYKQCVEMCKHYDIPTLLIEFDEAKSFSSLSTEDSERAKNSDMERLMREGVQSKLTLLFLTFPKLQCIWSSSPFQTAEIFMDLKAGRKEPDFDTAMSFGRRSTSADMEDEVENDDAIAMLQSIPGINHTNYKRVISKVKNMKHLCQLSEPQLAEIIGKEAAAKVSRFLRTQSTK